MKIILVSHCLWPTSQTHSITDEEVWADSNNQFEARAHTGEHWATFRTTADRHAPPARRYAEGTPRAFSGLSAVYRTNWHCLLGWPGDCGAEVTRSRLVDR